jgi:hypothetical protein
MNTIAGLPTVTTPSPTAVVPIVQGGNTGKITLADLARVIPAATLSAAGLMSSSDKQTLDDVVGAVSVLTNDPVVVSVESRQTITIPTGAKVVSLTGDSDVGVVLGGVPFETYIFYRESGPPITVLGSVLPPQGSLIFLRTP